MKTLLIFLLILNLLNAKKIALLIGNSQYSFQPLANPLNDVDGIYKTLDEIGFDNIKVLKNASKSQMETALANFSQRASSAKIALVYFSGHGMQVNNTNYMFPANTTAKKPVDLFRLVDLNYFIQSATSAKYGIVLVDACRNNPLVKYFQNRKHKGDSAKKGLGQVTPKSGQVVIGFATKAGEWAEDGYANMSPYAEALSRRLKTPNKDITKVLGLVALDVSANYQQNPILQTNLAYDVCLYGQCGYSSLKTEPEVRIIYKDRPQNIEQILPKTTQQIYTNGDCKIGYNLVYTLYARQPAGLLTSSRNLIQLLKICQNNKETIILEKSILGTFSNKPNEYNIYHTEKNKPPYGYSRYAYYNNTRYKGLRENNMYASDTKRELINKVRNDIATKKCRRWASNYSRGNLNNDDNFWSYFCPKENLVLHLKSINIK
jgi:hypothetical protein